MTRTIIDMPGLSRVLLISILLLGGCAPVPDDVIRFALASQVQNLDPRFATDATSARVNRLLYQRLVDFDAQQRPQPSLADWERLSPVHYRFRLRARRPEFHDGSPLTANDVAATYRSILAPSAGSPHAGTLRMIDQINVLDDETIDFHLSRPDVLFPGYLVIGILPESVIDAGSSVERSPVGSGPFMLDSWPDPGRIRLQRRSDRQLVEFVRIADPTVRILKLLSGEVDILQNDLPVELVEYLSDKQGIEVHRGSGSNFAYIGFNLDDAAVSDLRIRRAIAYAIDREAIISYLFGGAARPAEALLPPEHWAGHDRLEPYRYDPDLSRKLLAEAGYNEAVPLELEYKTTTDPVRLRIATVLQQQLASVGINMRLHSYDWGTFFGDIKAGRFQLYSLMWVGVTTPDIFRYVFHSESLPPQGANRGHFVDREIDRMLEQAESADSSEEQLVYWHEIQRQLHEQMPYIPLWYEDHVVVHRTTIKGYRLATDGNYDSLVNVTKTVP